jgi:hypothetical protein
MILPQQDIQLGPQQTTDKYTTQGSAELAQIPSDWK